MMTWNNMFFSNPSSSEMSLIYHFHDYICMFLISVFLMVSYLILSAPLFKSFSLGFSEDHQLEMVWTVVPFILLLFIIFVSVKSLYFVDSCYFCGFSVNIEAHQWYWSYFLKDLEVFFNSYMVSNSFIRLLEVDNTLVLPSLTPIRFLLTSSDVIHSWAVPSLGVKMDAVPGRINQFCLSSSRCGVFFGQCSEICGSNHSFMPIVLEVVSPVDFLEIA